MALIWSSRLGHARRKFYEIHQATQSPIAGEVIARIAALYRIEDAIRGRPPDERVAVRQRESRPKVEALKVYLETQLGRISGKSTLATAIRYALNHWDGLCVFLSDGRVEIDTNTIEHLRRHRRHRPAQRPVRRLGCRSPVVGDLHLADPERPMPHPA